MKTHKRTHTIDGNPNECVPNRKESDGIAELDHLTVDIDKDTDSSSDDEEIYRLKDIAELDRRKTDMSEDYTYRSKRRQSTSLNLIFC